MNREERQELVLENLPLVGYLVSGVCAKATHLSREDLAAAGAVALVASSQSFDPGSGVPFGAFARHRILGAMADDVGAGDWATRTRIKTTRKLQEILAGDLGRRPTVGELAETLGVHRTEVNAALADESGSVTLLDEDSVNLIADGLTPEESVLAAQDRLIVRASIQALPAKMSYIVDQLYFEDRSVTSLADELQITHSAVSQQRAEAMRLLGDGLNTCVSLTATKPAEVHSRISAPLLASYLTNTSLTAGGFTRNAAVPASEAAV